MQVNTRKTHCRECVVCISLLHYDVYQTMYLGRLATKCQLMREHSALSIESTSPNFASTDALARCTKICLTHFFEIVHFNLLTVAQQSMNHIAL